jgi:hypothetical protein
MCFDAIMLHRDAESGDVVTLRQVSSSMTIGDLKRLIEKQLGIKYLEMRLYFKDQLLVSADDKTLRDIGFTFFDFFKLIRLDTTHVRDETRAGFGRS